MMNPNTMLERKQDSPDITFPLTDFEDFYLHNQPSPTFTSDGQNYFKYPNAMNITELIICNFVGALSIPQNIVQLVNLFKTEPANEDNANADTGNESSEDEDYINEAEISQMIKEITPFNSPPNDTNMYYHPQPQNHTTVPPLIDSRYFNPNIPPMNEHFYAPYFVPYDQEQKKQFVDSPNLDQMNTAMMMTQQQQPQQPNFRRMDVASIMNYRLSFQEYIDYGLICKLNGHYLGSKHLQKLLKNMKKEYRIKMVSLTINQFVSNQTDLVKMSLDVYGNYLVQLLFEYGNDVHVETLINYYIYPCILRLSRNKFGCRVVQRMLASVSNQETLKKLVSAFTKQAAECEVFDVMDACLRCANTNHVIQAMVNLKLPYSAVRFIGNAVENDFVKYCDDMYACRVIQALVKNYGDGLDINMLFEHDAHLSLARGKFGNYVIQCFIRRSEWYSELQLIKRFRNRFILDVFGESNIVNLSMNKFGSNVIEKCIEASDFYQITFLNETLCKDEGYLLKEIMFHRFGNYVPRTLLEKVSIYPKEQRKLVTTVNSYIVDLSDSECTYYDEQSHGAAFIQSCQQMKIEMDRRHRGKSRYSRKRPRRFRQNY